MNVGHVMFSSNRSVVPSSMSLHEANSRMDEVAASGLMVKEGEAYKGVVSRWDIALQSLSGKDISKLTVGEVMTQPPVLDWADPIERAVDLLIRNVTRVVPVSQHGHFEGIVTWEQVDQFVKEILSVEGEGTRIHLALMNAPGQLARVLQVLAREKANVLSVIISEPKVTDLSHVVLKVDREHSDKAMRALQDNGFTLLT